MTTPTKEQLTELLERVRKAEGPDRGLDRYIQCLILNDGRLGDFKSASKWVEAARVNNWNTPRYTASIDAAVSLVERMLPGVEMEIHINRPKANWQTARIRTKPLQMVCGEEATPPLAILAALLQALIAQQEQSQ